MRVGWDARVLVNGPLRGMGSYALHLLPALRDCRPDLEFMLFHDGGTQPLPVQGFASKRIGPARGYRWQLWEQLGLPVHASVSRCDLLHSPANSTPPRSLLPRVVTLHDAMPFHAWNENASPLPYFQRTQRRAVASADAIITDSEHSKREISEVLQVPPDRITVIPLASSPEMVPPDIAERRSIMAELGIHSRFMLGLAAIAKRKNTRGILRAFAAVHDDFDDVSLVLTGVGPSLRSQMLSEISAAGIPESRVQLLSFVEPRLLAALYAECCAFCFLSLYEGFGLPILDAMQCGAPVICSTRTSCPEVAGNAAVMVDPENVDEVADAARRVLNRGDDEQLAWQRRGYAQAAQFTWSRTAALTARVYDSVAS